MLPPRTVDDFWHDRERELIRKGEIARLMSDGPVVMSEQNHPVVDWTARILRYVRASLGLPGSQVSADEPPCS